MKTSQEMEERIADAQHGLNTRVDALNEKVKKMTERYSEEAMEAQLFSKFIVGDKINYYKWTHEHSFLPGRTCFTSTDLIMPGTKAYKGTLKPATGDSGSYHFLPKEIWLLSEEFTMRRLKGQI